MLSISVLYQYRESMDKVGDRLLFLKAFSMHNYLVDAQSKHKTYALQL
ncbi:hypothetical protein ACVW0P_002580 [Mucilaginibacter sp. UYNi724]